MSRPKLWFIFFCYCIICVIFVSCAGSNQFPVIVNSGNIEGGITNNNSNTNNNSDTNTPRKAPEKSPSRIMKLPADTAETVYFLGISARKRSLQEAVNDAEQNAKIRVAGYIAASVEEKIDAASVYKSSMGQVIENTEIAVIASSSYISSVVSEVKTTGAPQETRYSDGTVEVQIIASVTRNLLEKAISDFNRIRDAAKTVRFTDGLSAYKVQKGESIEISAGITVNSTVSIGAIECIFTYGSVREAQSLTASDAVHFHIDTSRLAAGRYTGALELQMKKLSPGVENVRRTIVFEVLPLNTIRIALLNDDANSIASKIRDIMQKQGLLLVESVAAYIATVELSLNERQTNSYFYIEPSLTIVVELERDGTPLVTYTKKYGEFRHVTRAEALARAYRNIENDLGGNFAEQVRGIGK